MGWYKKKNKKSATFTGYFSSLFSDDCLLFKRDKTSRVRLVNEVLRAFCKVFGMKINVYKSKSFLIRIYLG